jgi:hypothetical protein
MEYHLVSAVEFMNLKGVTMTSNFEKKVYKPRPSTGWAWVGVLGLIMLSIGLSLIIQSGFTGPFIVAILISIPIGIVFLTIAVCFPSMRYEIDGTSLILTYGPLLRYIIDLEQVKSIKRRDMGFVIVSSFRFPGLALFSVPYPDVGSVKMCATAANSGILLIETESEKYGLTPADEKDFVAELQKRMGI